jgi:hypothetical protein
MWLDHTHTHTHTHAHVKGFGLNDIVNPRRIPGVETFRSKNDIPRVETFRSKHDIPGVETFRSKHEITISPFFNAPIANKRPGSLLGLAATL